MVPNRDYERYFCDDDVTTQFPRSDREELNQFRGRAGRVEHTIGRAELAEENG